MNTITIDLGTRSYPVHIGEIINITHNKILIVTNPKVAALHISSLLSKIVAKEVFIYTIKDGEAYKNMKSIEDILECAFIHKLDRKSLIIGFGGGVITDMAGFAAGIYQRGIDFINIPTTLLSQVDASIGGKTGINNAFGKNLIGLFYQPKAVYINPNFLSTLDKREFISGISEIIKMAVCFDGEFFKWLENANLNNQYDLEYAIERSIKIKADVIKQDEKESGIRAGLNYGHTFAHIIEMLGNYRDYLHGEAVSIGMIKANKLALKLGKINENEFNRIRDLLLSFGLPIDYKVKDKEFFYKQFYLDKKSQNNNLNFILPNGIGDMQIIQNPPKEFVLDIL